MIEVGHEHQARRSAPQSEIEALLPWHAAGTLSRREAEQVEDALARDPELARRYALVTEELGETIHLNETLGAPSARAMEKLFTARSTPSPSACASPSLNLGARVAEFFASLTPRTLAWSASAAALVLLLQAGIIAGVVFKGRASGSYQTASAPTTAPAAGSFALIRFAPQANAADVTKFLESQQTDDHGRPLGRRPLSGARRRE